MGDERFSWLLIVNRAGACSWVALHEAAPAAAHRIHSYHIRTEVILVVAMIAVGRHIIQFDFEHASGSVLAGIAMLMLALSASYFLVRGRGAKVLDAKLGNRSQENDKD